MNAETKTKQLDELQILREHDPDRYLANIQELSQQLRDCAEVQVEAAFALDANGDEVLAMEHYEAAYRLGVPSEHACAFALSYGAILNSTGRGEESLAILGQGTVDHPDYAPMRVMLAVALCNFGHASEAVAMLLEVVLMLGHGDDALDGYEEVFTKLQQDLLTDQSQVGMK